MVCLGFVRLKVCYHGVLIFSARNPNSTSKIKLALVIFHQATTRESPVKICLAVSEISLNE